MTATTHARPAGFSLLDVLNSVQGNPVGPGPTPHPSPITAHAIPATPRLTAHPTGAAWIPPAQRDLTVGQPAEPVASQPTAADPIALVMPSSQIADDLSFAAGGDHLRREGLELLRGLAKSA